MPKNKIKKLNRKNHLRRLFIGARIEFDGNEENSQRAVFSNGTILGETDINFIISNVFNWRIFIKFEFKNDLKFLRFYEEEFSTPKLHFNDLKDYADELATKAALGMPEGYVFYKNTWTARVTG